MVLLQKSSLNVKALYSTPPQEKCKVNSEFQCLSIYDKNTPRVAHGADEYPVLSTKWVLDYSVKTCRQTQAHRKLCIFVSVLVPDD